MSAGTPGAPAPGAFAACDRQAMSRALELAARGLETTHPNPRVGCVILKDGRLIGEGWHERAGDGHAEVEALRAARAAGEADGLAGATAYVTLEPCSHHGRTAPCVDALIEARIARVVFAMQDPDPRVSGRGAARLRSAGIRVESGLLEGEAAELNAGYVKRQTTRRPWVRLKLAASLDGRTALASGASRWITGEEAREDVQRWRARSSAVLTGIGTVLADDPRLDVRRPGAAVRQPARIVLDAALRTPPAARLFSAGGPVWIFTASQDAQRRRALEASGARIEHVPLGSAADGAAAGLDLKGVLERLAEAEMNEVHVEAGATLAGSFVRERLVDELLLYTAPILLGPQARPLAELPQLAHLRCAPRWTIVGTDRFGADLRMRLRPLDGPAQG